MDVVLFMFVWMCNWVLSAFEVGKNQIGAYCIYSGLVILHFYVF